MNTKNNKLHNDITIAQKLLCNSYRLKENKTFHELSRIYRATNECITAYPYFKILNDKQSVLSVIASGDQIINSIMLGTKDITGYDISIFPKYYLMLKLAAIKTLNKEEYLNFFLGRLGKDLLSYETYEKVRVGLEGDYLEFWDSLFDYFDEYEINESSLFSNEVTNKIIFEHNNPYLRGDNFQKTKNNLENVNISLLEGNVFKLVEQDIGTFDLINLSNILFLIKS